MFLENYMIFLIRTTIYLKVQLTRLLNDFREVKDLRVERYSRCDRSYWFYIFNCLKCFLAEIQNALHLLIVSKINQWYIFQKLFFFMYLRRGRSTKTSKTSHLLVCILVMCGNCLLLTNFKISPRTVQGYLFWNKTNQLLKEKCKKWLC